MTPQSEAQIAKESHYVCHKSNTSDDQLTFDIVKGGHLGSVLPE
jgi:hypothetical protein